MQIFNQLDIYVLNSIKKEFDIIHNAIINEMSTSQAYNLNDKWVKLTPSFDEGTAKKAGFLPMCEFVDGEDSLFPPHDINGKQFGEYVFDRGVHANLPLEDISRVFQEKYAGFKMLAKLYESGQIKSIEDIPRTNSAKY